MSPGDRSYDAIGLMKQLSEQTAGAFADAQEVLGGDTPESILRGRNSKTRMQMKIVLFCQPMLWYVKMIANNLVPRCDFLF